MSITLAILQKLKNQYLRLDTGGKEYTLAVAPFAHTMTNLDFKFQDPATRTSGEDAREFWDEEMEFATIANSVIRNPHIWQIDSQALLYDEYKNILENAMLIDPLTFTAEEQTRMEEARKKLFNTEGEDSEKYKKYKKFQQEAADLEKKIVDHELSKSSIDASDTTGLTKWNNKKNELEHQKEELESRWEGLGFKTEVESALKDLRARNKKDEFLKQWRDTLNLKMGDQEVKKSGDIPFYETSCLPNDIYKAGSPVWKNIVITESEILALLSQASSDFPPDLPNVFNEQKAEIKKISFDVCIAEIRRSWFDEKLLINNYWKFNDESKKVSGGWDSYEGSIPAYPVKLILVKNVQFELAPGSQANEDLKKNLQNGKAVFLGPFLLKNIAINQNLTQVQTISTEKLSEARLNILANVAVEKPIDTRAATKKTALLKRLSVLQKPVNQTRLNLVSNEDMIRKRQLFTTLKTATTTKPVTPQTQPAKSRIKLSRMEAIHVSPKIIGTIKTTTTATPPSEEPSFYTVTGSIVDGKNNKPVAGAEVILTKTSTTSLQSFITGDDGMYNIANIEKGSYHFTVRKNGYINTEEDMTIDGNKSISKVLLPAPEPSESFQLLAVICKKLPKLPDPVPGAEYV